MKIQALPLITLLAGLSMFTTGYTQIKIGHLNSDELVMVMPETDSINKILQDLADDYQKLIEELDVEYNKEMEDYNQNLATYKAMERKLKEEELIDMKKRIQKFASESQQDYQNQQQTLFQPIWKKAQEAIQMVAKENGFTYVIDSARGTLLYLPEDETLNLLPRVKAKLGIGVTR